MNPFGAISTHLVLSKDVPFLSLEGLRLPQGLLEMQP